MSIAEIQAKIRNLLSEGKYNEAFHLALTANNLTVVVATCEMVNIQILNQVPCPLSQEILLTLIQQLGHNLESNTDYDPHDNYSYINILKNINNIFYK